MDKVSEVISPSIAILVVIATFLLFLFSTAAVFILFWPPFALVFGELFLMVIPLGYMLYKKIDIKNFIGVKVNLRTIGLGIAFGIILFLFDLFISNLLVSIFGKSEALRESNELLLNSSGSLEGLTMVIVAMSLTGVCEEFTFRGFLQTAINSKYSTTVAILISSLAFGLAHFDPQGLSIIATFLMGLILGYIYRHWRSYVIPAVAHSTLNLVILAITLLAV